MDLISFDIETFGTLPEYALQPWRAKTGDAWLTSAAFVDDAGAHAYTMPDTEKLREWLVYCAENNKRIVAWNSPFDVSWLIALGLRDEVFACQWLDAMLLRRHLTNEPSFLPKRLSLSLKTAVADYFPEHAGYEKDIDFGATDDESLKLLTEYNVKDAAFTRRLAEIFWDEMTAGQRRVALIEASCIPQVAESIVNGIAIDTDAATTLADKLQDTSNISYAALKLTVPEITPEDLASPTKLGNLMSVSWGLMPVKLTGTGSFSTDKEALAKLADIDPRAKFVHDYREANGNKTKFVDNTLESVAYNGTGLTHPQFRIFGTYTGRGTYSSTQGKGKSERQVGVALHQWKRDPAFRRIIKPPHGYTLLEFDFAGQEFRWMAVESNDDAMLAMCAPGEDAHAFMAARIAGIPYDRLRADLEDKVPGAKDKRQLGKVANLSCQYKTSANRLKIVAKTQYALDLSDPEAQKIHRMYRVAYPNVPRYWDRQVRRARFDGTITNLAGRTVRLGRADEWEKDLIWSYEATSINFPIQSIGADQKYLALMIARNYLPKVNGYFYMELHDGLFFVVPNDKAEIAARDIKRLLSNLPYQRAWGLTLPIQFPVDAKLGPSWGDLKEFNE